MATELPITNGYYVSRSLPISHQRCSNVFVSIPATIALSKEQLLLTPGIEQLATTGTVLQKNRGSHVKEGIPYFVNGDALYRLNRIETVVEGVTVVSFTTTNLGGIEGSGRVSMVDNGFQLLILVPGGKGYIWDDTTFQEITDTDFTASGNPQIVVFVDGYFLFSTDSKKFIISSLNDGLTYNALDFSSAESDPDIIVAPIVIDNQVYILGSETTEGFQNIPSVGRFPFVRNNVILDKGCSAPFSLVKSNSSFFMIGAGVDESPAIWQFAGNSFIKRSTEAIDALLATLTETEISEVFAIAYADSGYYFVSFSLPNTTIVYELTTGRWHERNSTIEEIEDTWRVNSLVTAYGKVLVGDSVDGRIGQLSLDILKEYENNIIRLFTTQPFSNMGNEVVSTMLELTMESGAGNDDVPEPVVSMSISSNGKTFSQERVRKIGRVGEFDRRTVWYKNGRFDRFAVLLFRMSDAIKTAFIKLEVE